MRMKHADAPERFMDSEVDLDEVRPSSSSTWLRQPRCRRRSVQALSCFARPQTS